MRFTDYHRFKRQTLLCSFCGREIPLGEEYWACSGTVICPSCLVDFARQELSCCREIRGKESCP